MEKNGRKSCTVNSRYIVVRCFFTKGIIKKGEMVVEYCPTELMMADFFTKDLQGRAFKFFRDIIMGYATIAEIIKTLNDNNVYFPIKECVENYDMSKNGEK